MQKENNYFSHKYDLTVSVTILSSAEAAVLEGGREGGEIEEEVAMVDKVVELSLGLVLELESLV